MVCPECGGTRLRKEAGYFKIDGKCIWDVSAMEISALAKWLDELPSRLDSRQNAIASEILKELRERTAFLLDVGLDYLSLDRATASLSGGESQRIRLATQIGSKLVNVLYILDEPSIGLHQRDNIKLINSLKELRDSGNSVMVVEHDEETMRAADWIVDVGPGAGQEANMDFLEEVALLAKEKHVPVFCNTGCRHDTIEKILQVADGACVGTALKGADGRVDLEKVRSFMAIARR